MGFWAGARSLSKALEATSDWEQLKVEAPFNVKHLGFDSTQTFRLGARQLEAESCTIWHFSFDLINRQVM